MHSFLANNKIKNFKLKKRKKNSVYYIKHHYLNNNNKDIRNYFFNFFKK